MRFKLFLRLSIFKTIRFNFHYFGWNGLFHFPALIARSVQLKSLKGRILIPSLKFNQIMIGFPSLGINNDNSTKGSFDLNGTINIKHRLCLAAGASLSVGKYGKVDIGDLIVNGNTSIICFKHVSFGDDCLCSWGDNYGYGFS